MADHHRVKDLDQEVVNKWDTEDMTREADLEVEDGEEDGRVVSISFNFVCIFFYNSHAGDGSDIAAFEKCIASSQDMAVSINGCLGQPPRGKGAW